MKEAKRDQRLVQSEAAIIKAGIKTLLDNPSAGMSEVALASGVGRTTLYRHYESREALIRAITLHCMDELDAALRPLYASTGRRAIAATFEALLPVADRYRFLSSLWTEVEADPLIARRMDESSRDTRALIDYAKSEGEIDPDLPSEWLARFFSMTLYAAWSYLESGATTSEEAARLATRSFLRGCGSR